MPLVQSAVARSPIVTSMVLALVAVCGSGAAQAQEVFVGTVVYESSAGGPNTDGAELFNGLGPSRESVTWGSGGKLRVETTGGMLEGIIVMRLADSAFFALDTVARTAHPAELESMNPDDLDPEVSQIFGDRFSYPVVERTDQEGSYAGRGCRMYVIRRSWALRRGATARVCLAEDIRVRPSSYSFEWNDGMRTAMVSLPVAFNIREGLPLMMEVNENNTIVTYRAVSISPGEPADALFSVPQGYTIEAADSDN